MYEYLHRLSSPGGGPKLPSRLFFKVAFAGLVVIFGGSPCEGQESSPPLARFSSEVSVEVVTVDVVVTDRKGKPILGLDRDDFRVFEDGVEMEITNFFASQDRLSSPESDTVSAIEVDSITDPPQPIPQEASDRHVVLYLDQVFMRPQSLRRLIPKIQQFIKEQLPPGTMMMLVAHNGLVNIRVPFTDDVGQILNALDNEIKVAGHAGILDGFENMMLRSWVQAEDAVAGGDPAMIAAVAAERQASLDALTEDYRSLIRMTWRNLQYFVDSFAAVPGRKIIFHISDGIPYRPDQWNNPGSTTTDGRNVRPEGSPRDLSEVIAHACTLGVTIHTIYGEGGPRGLASGTAISPEISGGVAFRNSDMIRAQQSNAYFNNTTTLQSMAEGTGGMSVLKPTKATLAPLGADVRTYYSLGFRPPRSGDGKTHTIDVEIDRKGARVRHRSRYTALSARDRVAAQTLATLVLPEVDNPLGISWTVPRPGKPEGEEIRVPIEVYLPSDGLAFQPVGDKWVGRVRVFMVTADLERKLGPLIEMVYPIEVAGPPSEDNKFIFHIPMVVTLTPGQYTVAVTVLDEISGISSSIPTDVLFDRSGGVWQLVKKEPEHGGIDGSSGFR